jgi:hypothetical protein
MVRKPCAGSFTAPNRPNRLADRKGGKRFDHAGFCIVVQDRHADSGGSSLQHPLVPPSTRQLPAMQQTPLLQAPSPWQVTSQVSEDDLQTMGASHAEPPSQRMSQSVAAHSRPPPHALAFRQSMPHFDPPHFTFPPQLEAPLHSMEHELAAVQSTPPEQAESALHFTLQAMPSGHRTTVLHP